MRKILAAFVVLLLAGPAFAWNEKATWSAVG